MLTRLKVSGFKNLVDVDVRFGPFTCIAGANGVGKSNLFDAIRFLSALASNTLVEAAKSVREGKTADVRSLFHRVGSDFDDKMSFTAEMIVPRRGFDDLGQKAEATIPFLRYTIELAMKKAESHYAFGGLELCKEELRHINFGEANKHLLFPHSYKWRKSTVKGRRTVAFISTENTGPDRAEVKLHQDRGDSGGRPASFLASTLPRTVLSSANAGENRTAVLARLEMQSWRILQLDPAALREPDEIGTPPRLGNNGAHLAATLYHLARGGVGPHDPSASDQANVYAKIANRLAQLIDDVRDVGINVDHQRELLTLFAKGKDGTEHPGRALSDGTLRFLALAVIELDPSNQGLLCLEEPENGIHPERIPAMLRLLRDIAVDPMEEVGSDNPLRQVIINTHSPSVVSEVLDDSLIVAESKEKVQEERRFRHVSFACLPETWRADKAPPEERPDIVSRGTLLSYLNPSAEKEPLPTHNGHSQVPLKQHRRPKRVIDRDDMQKLLNFGRDEE